MSLDSLKDLKFDDVKNKFSHLFRVTEFILKPYIKLKYQPKKEKTIEDRLLQIFVWVSSWLVVAVIYTVYIYLFVYEKPDGTGGKFSDFFTRPPIEILNEVFSVIKNTIYFNLSFLVVLYFAIVFHAEKTYLEGRYVHLSLSGLIKTLKLGFFDRSSNIKEQDSSQITLGRANIFSTANDSSKELLSIVSASGLDLFGGAEVKDIPVVVKKQGWLKTLLNKGTFDDGYLLCVIAEKFRKVQIILLNPDSDAVKKRAESYLKDDSHKPIKSSEEYLNSLRAAIENIKKAYKKNRNIELKLVDEIPQWKMIIVEGEAWVQPIIDGIRSDHCPLYGFSKTEYSMYHTFWHINESMWHDEKSVKVDLNS